MSESFTPTERSQVRRAHQRGHYDRETLYSVLDAGMICHVGYVIAGQPYVTPTIYWRDGDDIYFHGSSASRMLRQVKEGIPVCLTVSHLDGLVVARSGFHCSANYRSAMLFGTAVAIEERAEMDRVLKDFVEGLLPGHWDQMRAPNEPEMKGTTVCRMKVEEASAKIRTGPPIDDEEDYALDCWAGVLPIKTVIGAPERDPRLSDGIKEPDYLTAFKLG
jgi:nitroimidazol reductase NimA-like FMN-containing flavoprotein (pyridoxamine 5'-phosphate oxidase superfamily)